MRNIYNSGYHNITVVSRSGSLPGEFAHLPVFSSLSAAISSANFHAAVVCTPTSLHIDSLQLLLEARVPNIYIEKPVSHSLQGFDRLLALSKSYASNIIVGYDLHFDPGLQKVKQLLQEGVIGKIVSVNAQVGQYLPDWRPHEDYRQGMSARKKSGGGVMLDLVHEFDYLLWLVGDVITIACQYSHTGALEIETEDVSDVLLRFASGATGTIHLDYLQQKLVRNCLLTGHHGTIFWNLASSKVQWIDKHKHEQEFSYAGFERNERFVQIIKAFLENKNDPRLTTFQESLKSLQLVLAAKHSSENSVFVNPALLVEN